MERIIVTVKRQQEARVRDLEVPAGVKAAQLADLIAAALHWDRDSAGGSVSYQIEAEPPGRVLEPDETLTGAGVGDGAWLTFIAQAHEAERVPALPAEASQPGRADAKTPSPRGPVVKWESLFPDGTGKPAPEPPKDVKPADEPPEDQAPESPFVWKELDL